MKDRNEYLELDGLFWESETHEWFYDKGTTGYANQENLNGISLPNIKCFVVREKETGEYNRVVMDSKLNEIVYDTKSLEELGFYIDKLKVILLYEK